MKKIVLIMSLLSLVLLSCSDSSSSTSVENYTESIYMAGGTGKGFLSSYNKGSLNLDIQELKAIGFDIEEYQGKLYIPVYDKKLIYVFEPKTEELTFFSTNLEPWRIAITNDKIYITGLLEPGVEVRSLENYSLIKNIPLGGITGNGMEIFANGNEVYVSRKNNGWEIKNCDDIMKINAINDEIVDSVTVKKQPWDMLIDNEGDLHVLNRGIDEPSTNIKEDKGSVSIIDLKTFDIKETIYLNYQLESFAMNSTGDIYITCGDWVSDSNAYGMIMKYNSTTNQIINGPENPFYKSNDIYDGMLDIIIDKEDRMFVAHYDGNFVIYENDIAIDTLTVKNGVEEMVLVKN